MLDIGIPMQRAAVYQTALTAHLTLSCCAPTVTGGGAEPESTKNFLRTLHMCPNGSDRTCACNLRSWTLLHRAPIAFGSRTHGSPGAIALQHRGDRPYTQKHRREYDRAVRDFDQSIKLNSTNPNTFNNARALGLLQKGRRYQHPR